VAAGAEKEGFKKDSGHKYLLKDAPRSDELRAEERKMSLSPYAGGVHREKINNTLPAVTGATSQGTVE